jgi:hypothetical protein
MLIRTPPKYVKRHRPLKKKPQFGPPPAVLTLVEASYSTDDGALVRLKFDRAIDIAGIDEGQIGVRDGLFLHQQLVGNAGGVVVIDPQTIDVYLTATGAYAGADQLLTATGATGIVAVDDGAAWAGVSDLALPWP